MEAKKRVTCLCSFTSNPSKISPTLHFPETPVSARRRPLVINEDVSANLSRPCGLRVSPQWLHTTFLAFEAVVAQWVCFPDSVTLQTSEFDVRQVHSPAFDLAREGCLTDAGLADHMESIPVGIFSKSTGDIFDRTYDKPS